MTTLGHRYKAALDELGERANVHSSRQRYQPHAFRAGLPERPVLQLEDVSGIPFLDDISGADLYQHRARVRAASGDLFCAVTDPVLGYEEYCRELLNLGDIEFVRADAAGNPLRVARAARREQSLSKIVARARAAGGMCVHPYMGVEDVWELAADMANLGGVPVHVLGPPPYATWLANDKALFSELVELALGPDWLVEGFTESDPRNIARRLHELAGRHPRVGLKRVRCASAMGNEVFDSGQLASSRQQAERAVDAFLRRTQWPRGEDVMAVAWETASHSPSTQLWIPPLGAGPPRLDGVYEQILEGEAKVFVGSRPSALPEAVNRALGQAAVKVASGLQYLGYVGRCSFDHLVVGDVCGESRLLFTECNGRWGGTSTPMHLVDRLWTGDRPPYRAQDFIDDGLVGARFNELLDRVRELLFVPGRGGRFVFYNVGPLEPFGKLDVISLGQSQAQAEEGLLETLPELLRRG